MKKILTFAFSFSIFMFAHANSIKETTLLDAEFAELQLTTFESSSNELYGGCGEFADEVESLVQDLTGNTNTYDVWIAAWEACYNGDY